MARVIHFEIPADDTQRARAFYEGVFGWQFQAWEGGGEGDPYLLIRTGDEGEPGIDGGMMRRQHPGHLPTSIIGVDSVDEACKKVVAAGGEIALPKMELPGIGAVAYFKDPEGNILGLFEASHE